MVNFFSMFLSLDCNMSFCPLMLPNLLLGNCAGLGCHRMLSDQNSGSRSVVASSLHTSSLHIHPDFQLEGRQTQNCTDMLGCRVLMVSGLGRPRAVCLASPFLVRPSHGYPVVHIWLPAQSAHHSSTQGGLGWPCLTPHLPNWRSTYSYLE